ncbi:MAG: hypothetical protein HGA80_06810 [Candidatus Omnitrophica bacterium]|nr:hypothetical protein [Candidatus Omnitrophota bacterium]
MARDDARHKTVIFAVLAGVLSLTLACALLELGVAFLVYQRGDYLSELDPAFRTRLAAQDPAGYTEKPLYHCDPKVGQVQTPSNSGFWRGFSYPTAEFRHPIFINAEGFRSRREYDAVDGARVAVLGDSFVQGLQVREEDTFLQVAERKLRAEGQAVSVLNYGECGTGTAQQYRIFEEYVLKRRLQAVVLAVYSNDLTDDSPAYLHEQPGLVPHYSLTPSGEFILEDFQCTGRTEGLAKMPLRTVVARPAWRVLSGVTALLDRARFSLSLRYLSCLIKDRFLPKADYDPSLDVYKKVYPPALQESLRFTVSLIERMHRRCQQEGITFMVMMIPAPEQVQPALWQGYLRSRSKALSAEDFDLESPQQKLRQELVARGIVWVDLLTAYREAGRREQLYYPKDRHFNVNGHRLAGRILAELLRPYLAH